jgi:Tol biopolymer transport system component
MSDRVLRLSAVVVLIASAARAQVTQRVSVTSAGTQVSDGSYASSISADGRFVAFDSYSDDLVPGDTNNDLDVFVHDRQTGITEQISVDSAGVGANALSDYPSISADGRYVAFGSYATNLVPGDAPGQDVYLRDRWSGTTEKMSVDSSGVPGDLWSLLPSISADGRYVAFMSYARNLVPGDTNVERDVFVHDRQTGATERVSVATGGAQGNGRSDVPSISADGRFVAFHSAATNFVPGDTNGSTDVFLRDRLSGTTELVNVGPGGVWGNHDSQNASVSDDGRFVAFETLATNLVPGDTNGVSDILVRDRQNGTTERISVAPGGEEGNLGSIFCAISADGRRVVFQSSATNLVPGDTNTCGDIFVRDRETASTERASVATDGAQGDSWSFYPSISDDGRFAVFYSDASNLVPGDSNGFNDIFVHDRDSTGFTSTCDPGFAGVLACPCSNDPSGRGRGCDNSAATGGARLSASGIAYLSMDNLVLTTSGETPGALSILLQGSDTAPTGLVFGQGVSCVGGTILRRLFARVATGDGIAVPDFPAGDPTISARSAAKGEPIQAGEARWYVVYYRDPLVPGGCPSTSTFNATQTGKVAWSL